MSISKEEVTSELSTAIVSWCDVWCPVLTMSEYDPCTLYERELELVFSALPIFVSTYYYSEELDIGVLVFCLVSKATQNPLATKNLLRTTN